MFASVVLAALAAGILAFPGPATADHGYQTYGFNNQTKKPVHGVVLVFDTKISHVEEHTWPRGECEIRDPKAVRCAGRALDTDDGFTVAVATPPPASGTPPYVEADLGVWFWFDKKGNPGADNRKCPRNPPRNKPPCRYFGTTVPARPIGHRAGA